MVLGNIRFLIFLSLEWLHAFQDPREAVKKEVETIKESPFVPETLVLHGLVYDLPSEI